MTKIKICGITRPEEIEYLNEANVDYAGFVIYEKSKRYITVERAAAMAQNLNENIKKVAVTVSPDVELLKMIEQNGFDIIQVHRGLSKDVLNAANIPIWYAINVEDTGQAKMTMEWMKGLPIMLGSKIRALLIDAPEFGSGQTFDWEKSKRQLKAGMLSPPIEDDLFSRKLILAGGLDASNVAEGIEIFRPYIVDVSSSVEGENGKDKDKILDFVHAVRDYDMKDERQERDE